jgi:hypothetical protein
MDHSDALKIQAPEKYLLNELSEEERDSFEDHYFSCAECAGEVRAGAIFVANARELVRSSVPTSVVPRAIRAERWNWFGWLQPAWAAAAIVLFVGLIGFQNLVTIPRLHREIASNAPQALPAVFLMAARGTPEATITVAPNAAFGLNLDIPPAPGFASFECEVVATGSSKPSFSVHVSAQRAHNTVQLFVPGGLLAAGRYTLVVRGNKADSGSQTASEILAQYPFTIRNE